MKWKFLLTLVILSLPLVFSVPQISPDDSYANGDKIYAEHPKGCAHLKCESGAQCVNRKFWCKNMPCPNMLYCSRNRRESLRGPPTCDSVRCSKGYSCLVKVRRCRWDKKCKQQMARCVSKQEYYEGAAFCTGSSCGPGYRCILRESLCSLPPCRLLTSCAKEEDVQAWFDRCKGLGCPSEYECFLRKSIENCPNPPCKHTPDCTTTNENEVPPNEHCRGWVCPRIQECSAYVQEPCGPDGCKINRSCHGPLIGPTTAAGSPEAQGPRRTFTLRPDFQSVTEVISGNTEAPTRKPLRPLKTLTQMENELARQMQRTTTRERASTDSVPSSTTEMAAVTGLGENRGKVNQSILASNGVADEISNLGTPVRVVPTARPTPAASTLPSTILSYGKSTTSAATSSWLNHLRLKIGGDAIDVWVKRAQEGKDYSKFEEWLESVEETLGPENFESWLEEVRTMTLNSRKFQEWLPPPLYPRFQDSHQFFDPGSRLADMEDEFLAVFPKTYDPETRANDWTNRSVHLPRWNVPAEEGDSNYENAVPDGTTAGSKGSPNDSPGHRLSQENHFDRARAYDDGSLETTTTSLRQDNDPATKRPADPYNVNVANARIPKRYHANRDEHASREWMSSSAPGVPYRGSSLVRHWSDQTHFGPKVNNFPRFESEQADPNEDRTAAKDDYPAALVRPSRKRVGSSLKKPRVELVNRSDESTSRWIGGAEKSKENDSRRNDEGSLDSEKNSVRHLSRAKPLPWNKTDHNASRLAGDTADKNDSSRRMDDRADKTLGCEQSKRRDPLSKTSQLYQDKGQTTLNMFMPSRLQVSIPIIPWKVKSGDRDTRRYLSFRNSAGNAEAMDERDDPAEPSADEQDEYRGYYQQDQGLPYNYNSDYRSKQEYEKSLPADGQIGEEEGEEEEEEELIVPRQLIESLFQRNGEGVLWDWNKQKQAEVNYDHSEDPRRTLSVNSAAADDNIPEDFELFGYESTSDDSDYRRDSSNRGRANEIVGRRTAELSSELTRKRRDLDTEAAGRLEFVAKSRLVGADKLADPRQLGSTARGCEFGNPSNNYDRERA